MLVGFVFWYRGLALGGIAGVGQLQLLQPFFGQALAGLLLHEPVAWTMIAVTALVVLCVAGAKRFAQRPTSAAPAEANWLARYRQNFARASGNRGGPSGLRPGVVVAGWAPPTPRCGKRHDRLLAVGFNRRSMA
jgi:hypothetical protein